jgi:uncharacterized damage-inducible protein DinB
VPGDEAVLRGIVESILDVAISDRSESGLPRRRTTSSLTEKCERIVNRLQIKPPASTLSLSESFNWLWHVDSAHRIMDQLDYLRREFTYDAWANGQVFAAIKTGNAQTSLKRPLELLAHILSAERLWLERLNQQPQTQAVWPELTLAQCETEIDEVARLWRKYLSELSDSVLARTVPYKNSKGELWSSTVQDVLTHVMLHSAYHRGQIASSLRASGIAPAYTDFIHAVRQKLIE